MEAALSSSKHITGAVVASCGWPQLSRGHRMLSKTASIQHLTGACSTQDD